MKIEYALKINALILIVLFTTVQGYTQGYKVYKVDELYICLTPDHKELIRSEVASEVIQKAITESARSGVNEVEISSGFYWLNKPIEAVDNVWIHGKKRGTELKLSFSSDHCIVARNVSNVVLSDLTFSAGKNRGASCALLISNSSRIKLKDLTVFGFPKVGLKVTGNSPSLAIQRCKFIGNDLAHVRLSSTGLNARNPIQIIECTFLRGGYGVITEAGESSKGLIIQSNMSAYTRGPFLDTDFDSAIVLSNRNYWGESDGVVIRGRGFYVSGNSFSWNRGHALVLDGARNGEVLANNLTDMGARSRDGLRKCGLAMYNTEGVKVAANSIWNFGDQGLIEYAIYEDKSCVGNELFANSGWFHASSEGFGLFGKGSKAYDNVSNEGQYRDDYWDFSHKFGGTVEKYVEDLALEVVATSVREVPNIELPAGPVLLECKDMFGQVLSVRDGTVKKFGYVNKMQKWELHKNGEYYRIICPESGEVLTVQDKRENAFVIPSKKGKEEGQLWQVVGLENGYVKIINKLSGKALEAQGLDNFSWEINKVIYLGQQVTVSDFNSRPSQMWRFIQPSRVYAYGDNK